MEVVLYVPSHGRRIRQCWTGWKPRAHLRRECCMAQPFPILAISVYRDSSRAKLPSSMTKTRGKRCQLRSMADLLRCSTFGTTRPGWHLPCCAFDSLTLATSVRSSSAQLERKRRCPKLRRAGLRMERGRRLPMPVQIRSGSRAASWLLEAGMLPPSERSEPPPARSIAAVMRFAPATRRSSWAGCCSEGDGRHRHGISSSTRSIDFTTLLHPSLRSRPRPALDLQRQTSVACQMGNAHVAPR